MYSVFSYFFHVILRISATRFMLLCVFFAKFDASSLYFWGNVKGLNFNMCFFLDSDAEVVLQVSIVAFYVVIFSVQTCC